MPRRIHLMVPTIVALCAALFASPAAAQIGFVKTIGTAQTSLTGTSTAVTVPVSAVAAGNSIIVSLAMDPVAGTVSCADTVSNNYVVDRDVTNGSATAGVRTVILSAHNVIALVSGNTITCAHPSVAARALSLNEFSGLAASSARDQSAAGIGASTSPSSGSSPNTTQAAELLIGAIGVEGKPNETFTPGIGYTTIGRVGTASGSSLKNITINPEYRTVLATGAYSALATLGDSRNWAAAIVTYKGALTAATITGVAPSSGPIGTVVTVNGSGFGATQGSNTITFNGTSATPSSWSSTSIIAPVPSAATTGPIVVTVAGAASNGVTFTVTSLSPDLVVSSISNPPASAVVGGSFSVTDTTANNGTGSAGSSTTRYRLSTDGTITAADTLLTETRSVAALNAGANSSGTVSVTIPNSLTPGSYFLGACADDLAAVNESSETNNCLASSTPVVISAAPSISALNPTSGTIGTSVTISGSNFGSVQGTSIVTFNGTVASPSNWGGSSIVVTVPNGATTGTVIVTVGGVASNGVAFTVTVSLPLADLQVISLSAPTASATAGTSFQVIDTTMNLGNASAAASTTKYRLSLDTVITATDPLLIGTRAIPSLDVGMSSSGTVTVTVPQTVPPGAYYLAACADDDNVVSESNEINNCRLSTMTAQVQSARDKGLGWMITQQQADGSWKSTAGTAVVATATAVEAFNAALLKNFAFAAGVSWLANESAASTDSLSRQILALKRAADMNVSDHVGKLLAWRNFRQTWGAYAGFDVGFPDTPLALKALRIAGAGYADAELQNGLCLMLQSQKQGAPIIHGSWSFISVFGVAPPSAVGSAILPTTESISEIYAIMVAKGWASVNCNNGPWFLQTIVDLGVDWLISQRNKLDGGFGDGSVSSVLETALVYEMLRLVRPADPATAGALTYLINSQTANGSWNNDVLQTAFVLKALPPNSSPSNDTDGDGIPDTIEIFIGGNPLVADSRGGFAGNQSLSSPQAPSVTELSDQLLSSSRRGSTSALGQASGDVNGDGVVDAADLALAEQVVLGHVIATPEQIERGDVAPTGNLDGMIDVNDVARIRRKILAIENF